MAKKKRNDATTDRAQGLLTWLTALSLPPRVLNALRRDLEVTLGLRVGEQDSGVLIGLDQTRFIEELYHEHGGQIRLVPSVAGNAIAALRAVVPPPTMQDGQAPANEFELPLLDDEPFLGVSHAVADDFELPPLDDDELAVPTATLSADLPLVSASDIPENDEVARGVEEATPSEEPPPIAIAPLRRGRPRKNPDAPVVLRAKPARRIKKVVTAFVAPVTNLPPALVAPMRAPVAQREPDEPAQMLQLWRKLHPQGRRAALDYIATLLVEG